MKKALIVIDVQNDYFAGGAFPQWQADETAARIAGHIRRAKEVGDLVVNVVHCSASAEAPLFRPDSLGLKVHDSVASLPADAPQVVKQRADSFLLPKPQMKYCSKRALIPWNCAA